ncbi:hypothetical protein CRUP_020269, partial [Coryphaenoides rupestris]
MRSAWPGRNTSIDSGSVEVGRRVSQEVPPGVFWRSLLHLGQPQFLKFNISLGKDALFGVYIRKGLAPSHAQTVVLNEAVFVQYLDGGAWHLAFYNDGRERETVSFSTNVMVDCVDPTCSNNGICVNGECHCKPGWGGPHCELPRAQCPDQCHGHGAFIPDTGLCSCDPNWMGPDCSMGGCFAGVTIVTHRAAGMANTKKNKSRGGGGPREEEEKRGRSFGKSLKNDPFGRPKSPRKMMVGDASREVTADQVCSVDCGTHGVCMAGACRCEEGWTGSGCDQRVCNPLCVKHGTCKDGKCQCHQGWNGEHCTIDLELLLLLLLLLLQTLTLLLLLLLMMMMMLSVSVSLGPAWLLWNLWWWWWLVVVVVVVVVV